LEERDQQEGVDCDNSSLLKAVIQCWLNRIGTGGLFGVEYAGGRACFVFLSKQKKARQQTGFSGSWR